MNFPSLLVLTISLHLVLCKLVPSSDSAALENSRANESYSNTTTDHLANDLDMEEDYDFVLNLDEQADLDRLLSLLSRSGPAKHADETSVGVSSTFIDSHYEQLDKLARPPNSLPSADSPHHADVRGNDTPKHTEEIDPEQKKLEDLYFKDFAPDSEAHSSEA
ncbi:uncharacterized protein LOC108676623 [Hyalella azteca]|uniref:Uncharacterized protein LOC108676623 n=1 Tax=Hyalella azteca TaxID=294128 RepID=A0A8B7P2I2_HYAAZ|nr:uncharacterized protein LOC108676623 [Hyalella azteca]